MKLDVHAKDQLKMMRIEDPETRQGAKVAKKGGGVEADREALQTVQGLRS
jgi:hypothetical protein